MSLINRYIVGAVITFSLAIAVFAFYLTSPERANAQELAMVTEQDPERTAQAHFEAGQHHFYQIYVRRFHPETGEDIGFWILVGESKIAGDLLAQFPERKRIELSSNYGLAPEHQNFNRRVRSWVLRYNLKMAEYLSEP